MAGSKEHKEGKQHETLEIMRNVGLGWAGLALVFSWGLLLPVVLAAGSQGVIEGGKGWGKFKTKLTEIFPGIKSHGKKH